MVAIATRSSVLAIKPETTEGTPLFPTSTGDYTALQDDFDMSPEFDNLESAELKSSIGQSKPIRGPENPTASFSHYLRSSGTPGTAPDYGEILKAAFGTETAAAAEYDTVASSTTTLIKLDTGEGANRTRGMALLIQDGTNGYSIRPVKSRSGDDLTLPFALSAAPAAGVLVGRPVTYSPASTGHQSVTLTHYLGNGGGIQMMAGAKCTEVGISASVGELLNASFSFEGTAYYFNPIEITSSTRYIDWTDDDGTWAASITAKIYKDPYELAQALQDAMNTASTETITVTYYSTGTYAGKFRIQATGTVLTLKFATGANTANTIATKIGFTVADESGTAATTGYYSDSVQSWASPYTPAYDNADPLAVKYHEAFIGDSNDDTTCLQISSIDFTLSNTNRKIEDLCAVSGFSGSVFNGRTVTVAITSYLQKHEAEKWKNFRANDTVEFCYNFGSRSGGNWEPGKCGCLYLPTATISSFDISDGDGLVQLDLELTAFVDSEGNGEVYLNFL